MCEEESFDPILVPGDPFPLLSEDPVPLEVLEPFGAFCIDLDFGGNHSLLELVEPLYLVDELALGERTFDHILAFDFYLQLINQLTYPIK